MRLIIILGLSQLISGCGVVAYVYPPVRTYIQEERGKADLAEATYNRQIKIQEAMASLEAAKSLAQAEIERAKGVAEANKIIGDSLKNNEGYLRYLWIKNLDDAEKTGSVIYVPTEAGLPILEAGRRKEHN